MKFDPERHHCCSIRLKGYDYSQPGAYCVTICAQDRASLFGEIVDSEMRLNEVGRMIERWWDELERFKTMTTNEYIRGVKTLDWTTFRDHLWQRNDYEHIIRNGNSLNCICEYILTNPMRWAIQENPYWEGIDPFDDWMNRFVRREDADAC